MKKKTKKTTIIIIIIMRTRSNKTADINHQNYTIMMMMLMNILFLFQKIRLKTALETSSSLTLNLIKKIHHIDGEMIVIEFDILSALPAGGNDDDGFSRVYAVFPVEYQDDT